jgi:SAM-dependent methyltransferase
MKICLKCSKTFSLDGWVCPACGYQPVMMNEIEAHAVEYAHSGGGFKAEYFSELSKLEDANFWFRARNALILWALNAYKPNAGNFLEVGCGTGFVLSGIAKSCPNISLSGSEIFVDGLFHAMGRVPAAKFMQMDARNIPYSEEFDVIGCFDVLEHIKEDDIVLSQLYKALKSEGILLLTVPQHPWLWSISDDYACHIRRYTKEEIEKRIRNEGFNILKSTSFVTSLLPAMMISRWLQKKSKSTFNPAGELKINTFANSIFYLLMRLEIIGIKLGFSYSVGGSRLIIARKS